MESQDTTIPLTPEIIRDLTVRFFSPVLIGSFLCVLLYGILLYQISTYWSVSPNDPSHIKAFVIWMLFLGTVSGACSIAGSYTLGVSSFGNVNTILDCTPLINTLVMCIGLSSSNAQAFFGFRVWRLTKSLWIPVFIWASALVELGCCLYIVTEIAILVSYKYDYVYVTEVTIWTSLSFVTDCVMSATQIIYLARHKTGFKKTDAVVARLNLLILQTGAITSVNAVLILALFRYGVSHEAATHMYFVIPMTPLYMNCVMSNLNARFGKDRLTEGAKLFGHGTATVPKTQILVHTNTTTDGQAASDLEMGKSRE